jgi:hypothetical protein
MRPLSLRKKMEEAERRKVEAERKKDAGAHAGVPSGSEA